MLAILFAFFLAAASALKIISPTDGENIPYNTDLTVFFDTEGEIIPTLRVSFNNVEICSLTFVNGVGSCKARANVIISGLMTIQAVGIFSKALRKYYTITVQIYPLAQSAPQLPAAEPEVNIYNLWQPASFERKYDSQNCACKKKGLF